MKPDLFKIAPPIFRWLLFVLIFLSQVPAYAASLSFASDYPKVDADYTKHNSLKLLVQANESGKAYYVILPSGDSAPTDAEIKAGQDNSGNPVDADKKGVLTLTADTEASSDIIGLSPATTYKIYVVAENSAQTLNAKAYVDVTTTAAPSDTTKPVFDTANGYPKTNNVTQTTLNLLVKTNEIGNVYYVILGNGATEPTKTQIKNGQDSTGATVDKKGTLSLSSANTEATASITGLAASTSYDIFIIAEDTSGNVSITYKLDVLTLEGTGNGTVVGGGTENTGGSQTVITGNYDNTNKTITDTDTITGTTTITGGTLDGSFDFTTTGLDVTLNNVTLAAGATIKGGKLQGKITGDANNPATLTNVQILADAILKNVIIGDGVTFQPNVTLIDVKFEGKKIKLSDVTLQGTITIVKTSITVFKNVQFGIGFTALSGGTLSGIIKSETGLSGSPSLTSLTFKDVTDFKAVGISVSNATFQGSFKATSIVVITNVILGLHLTSFSGGTLSGTIERAAGFSASASLTNLTLLNVTKFKAINVAVTNVTLEGTFTTTSTITLTNVKLGANVKITGNGISLGGKIQPAVAGTSISLTNLKIADNSIISKGITLGSGVTKGKGVQILTEETLETITSDVSLVGQTKTNISIGAGVKITGGTLGGTIKGEASNLPTLNGVTISSGATLSNIIIGDGVTFEFGVTLMNVKFEGKDIKLSDVTLQGTITIVKTSITVFTNVVFGANFTELSGGTLSGTVKTAAGFSGSASLTGLIFKDVKEFNVVGVSISNVTLIGAFKAISIIKFTNVTFGAGFKLTGEGKVTLAGTIKVMKNVTVSLTNLKIADNSIISKGVTLGSGVTKGKGVQILTEETLEAITSDVSLVGQTKTNISIGAGVKITGGTLGGTIKGDASNLPTLNGVTISSGATLSNIIIGDGVTFESGVTLMNVKFEGKDIKLSDVTLQGTITIVKTSITVFTNVVFGANFTGLSGGILSGTVETAAGFSGSASLTGLIFKDVKEFNVVGVSISNVTLIGAFKAISIIKFTNVTFGAGFKLTGEGKVTLAGTIKVMKNVTVSLTNLKIADNSIISKGVTLGSGVTKGKGVQILTEETLEAITGDVSLVGQTKTNISIAAGVKITGGTLGGTIKGDASNPPKLNNLKIAANSLVSNVIIGNGVTIPLNIKLGTGVKFTSANDIPVGLDLTATLPSFKAQIAEVKQPTVINLSADPIVNGKGLLQKINDQLNLLVNNLQIGQNNKTGNLVLEIEGFTFKAAPVKVKRANSKAGEGTQSVRLGFGNKVIFTTRGGIEIEAYPVVQNITVLKAILDTLNITKFSITEEGNFQIHTLDTRFWISGRAALSSQVTEAEETVGFNFEGDIVPFIFEDSNGRKRQQVLYPAPASNIAIELTGAASLTEEGILSFKLGERAYKGRLDYRIETGEAIESLRITDIADSNGDGLKDFLITYPQGYKQKLFALPAAK